MRLCKRRIDCTIRVVDDTLGHLRDNRPVVRLTQIVIPVCLVTPGGRVPHHRVNQQIAAAANSGKDGGEKLSDILAALGQFGSFVQDEDGMTLQFMDYITGTEQLDESAQISKDLDGYINAMQALSQNQDGLVAAGILEDGADGGNISPILDKLFAQ